ncbi:MAG: hypothetical protein MJY44_05020 [Bacteroidales bacterium]|nr:hypothetical protein [Bacteroidales bacterium]
MKKFLMAAALLLMCAGAVCSAQIKDGVELSVRGGSIYADGQKMTKDELAGLEGFDFRTYRRGRSQYVTGLTLVCVGVVPATLSGVLVGAIVSATKKGAEGIIPGLHEGVLLVMTGAATVALETAGIPMLCIGKKKIKKVAGAYNSTAGLNAAGGVQVTCVPSLECVPVGGSLQPSAGLTLAVRF